MTLLAKKPSTPGPARRSRGFLLGYGTAQAGAYIGFIPLLTLLLPLKADAIAGAGSALLLSQAAMVGGLVAAVANLGFGGLSDRPSRLGRRRPWILAAVPVVAITLALIGGAASPLQLIVALVLFQLAMNALYAPLSALVPDMVPDRQKGAISALASAALPVANVFTALVVVAAAGSIGTQFALVILAMTLLVLPFGLRLREPEATPGAVTALRPSFAAFGDVRFAVAFGSRLLAESGVAIHTLFLLFLIQRHPETARPEGWSVLESFSALLIASTAAAAMGGLLAGPVSDRVGWRAPFVIAGGAGMALGLLLLALWTDWPGMLLAQLLFGLFHGVHAASVAAMNAEILPDRARAGQDLGLMNLSVALPQTLAPALAAVVLTAGLPMTAVFLAASAVVMVAAISLTPLARRA